MDSATGVGSPVRQTHRLGPLRDGCEGSGECWNPPDAGMAKRIYLACYQLDQRKQIPLYLSRTPNPDYARGCGSGWFRRDMNCMTLMTRPDRAEARTRAGGWGFQEI